jgi:tripartite-type tricarboxylate transporter receptor subunit TctC
MFESLNSISSFAKSGQVRPIAVTGDHRSPAFPDVPTIAESGVPGYAAPSWSGVVGPAGLPKPITDKLNAASNKAIQSEMFKSRIEQIGDDVAGGTPDEFAAFIASESKKWGEVIERAGIRIE